MAKRINFTTRALRALPMSPDGKPVSYKDEGGPQSRRELYLRIGVRAKVFFWVRKVSGRTVRHRIGEFPAISVEQARKRCIELSAGADNGINPIEQKKKARQRGITLATAIDQYIEHAASRPEKPLSANTEKNYRRSMEKHFRRWLTKPAEELCFDMVAKWYKVAAAESASSANSALRVARAVFNHQQQISRRQQSDRFNFNPFVGHRLVSENVRDECIESTDLPQWFNAVNQLRNRTTRDYLLLLLFTGLRRREAATLAWSDIDLEKRTLIARDTKNGNDHIVPLSTYLITLLGNRRPENPIGFVFPGAGRSGHLTEPKKAAESIANKTGIRCSPHGLRRTYSNFAAFEAEIPELARKRLMNHAVDAGDVTAKHYSVLTLEKLRKYQQDVTDSIIAAGRISNPTDDVVQDSKHEPTEEELERYRRYSLERESGVYRLINFVSCMEKGIEVHADTMEFFHNAFKEILGELHTGELPGDIRMEDEAVAKLLARKLNLWSGMSLKKREKQRRDIRLSWELVVHSKEETNKLKTIQELAIKHGLKSTHEFEAFRKRCERAEKNTANGALDASKKTNN